MTAPKPNKDWILDNIRNIMKEKSIKVENLATSIGNSKGELSKILNGERKDYFKYLPDIAKGLNVSFHNLVSPQNENINDNGVGQAHILEQKDESIKNLLLAKDLIIDGKNEILAIQKNQIENLERKYKNLKEKLVDTELQLKKKE